MIHNEYAQENPTINRQDTEDHVPWICLPKEISQQCTPATHRSSALPGGPLGGLPSMSLTTEGSWIHLGAMVTKPLISPLMPVPPSRLERQRARLARLTQNDRVVTVDKNSIFIVQ